MKDLTRRSSPELIGEFRNACLAQDDTYLSENTKKRNNLFDYLLAVTRELKRRGVEERRSLLTLFADENRRCDCKQRILSIRSHR